MGCDFIIITGGPCCGKTTLLEAIKKLNINGVKIVFEMARIYIDEKMEQGLTLQEIRKDPWQFQTEVMLLHQSTLIRPSGSEEES